MNYELAKELKDAGFPQRFNIGKTFWAEKEARFGNVNNLHDGTDKISDPYLSELIEACGYGLVLCNFGGMEDRSIFSAQDQVHIREDMSKHVAAIEQNKYWVATKYRRQEKPEDYTLAGAAKLTFKGLGSTPEEAVAKLWLALNGKPL